MTNREHSPLTCLDCIKRQARERAQVSNAARRTERSIVRVF
jgi:hypothetical protein